MKNIFRLSLFLVLVSSPCLFGEKNAVNVFVPKNNDLATRLSKKIAELDVKIKNTDAKKKKLLFVLESVRNALERELRITKQLQKTGGFLSQDDYKKDTKKHSLPQKSRIISSLQIGVGAIGLLGLVENVVQSNYPKSNIALFWHLFESLKLAGGGEDRYCHIISKELALIIFAYSLVAELGLLVANAIVNRISRGRHRVAIEDLHAKILAMTQVLNNLGDAALDTKTFELSLELAQTGIESIKAGGLE